VDSPDVAGTKILSIRAAEGTDAIVDESVPQVLARQVETAGDRRALVWPEGDGWGALTYRELSDAATAVARTLATGAAPGDRVAVWGRNSVEWILLQYGCALAGLIVTPFNTAWTDAEVRQAHELTEPTLVFAGLARDGSDLTPRAGDSCPATPVVALAGLREWAPAGSATLPTVRPRDPYLIQFTSGTTGRAKGAVLSHRALINAALARARHDVIPDDDVWLNAIPYHHIGGFCNVVLGGLVNAGAFVVLDRFDPEQAVGLLDRDMVTRLGGVPTMIGDIVDRLGDRDRKTRLASVSTGGATVTGHLVDAVRRTFDAVVVVAYSQSECPAITHTDPHADPAAVAATVGRPVAAAEVRIVDPASGAPVPLGVTGEIVTRSPYVMDRYWGMPEHTARTLGPDGFLRTGDLGSMDAEGYLTFRGRARDVIIRGGENIYPAEIEEILLSHPGVANVVLVGVDDARLGERVAGVVVRRAGTAVTGAELAFFLSDRVAYFKIPSAWRFVESLPLTASGKVRRFIVRKETNAAFDPEDGAQTISE
jgi:acyl-CoA synthetase (AMP-forming)/AMP-acid ligase II